jgi:hypothetical protein
MYTIRTDPLKNRLFIKLVGFFSLEEIVLCGDETIQAAKTLKPGYDVITDISEFKPALPEVAKDIERVQAFFSSSGIRRGVRVVGSAVVTRNQFSRTSREAGYESSSFATLEEAEIFLNDLK